MIYTLRTANIVVFILLNQSVSAASIDCDLDQRSANQCAYNQFTAADSELNRKFALIADCFRGNAFMSDQLKRTQRAWIKFRDAECNFQAPCNKTAGEYCGTAQPMLDAQCDKKMTDRRIKDLDELIDCAGGERGGACPTIDCDFQKRKKP